MDLKQCTDAELVQLMIPGHGREPIIAEEAWREFITRFEIILIKALRLTYRRYAPHLQLNNEDVRDLIQQVFLKLAENDCRALRELDCYKETSVRLFVYAVASNAALDCLRASKVSRRPLIAHSLNDSEDMEEYVSLHTDPNFIREENPEELYLQKEMLKHVLSIVDSESNDKTRDRNRLIFFLAHRDGFTRSEIASRSDIGLKRTGINSLLNRIKKKLAEIYYGDLTDEPCRGSEGGGRGSGA